MISRNKCAKAEYRVLFFSVTVLSGSMYMLYLRALPFFSYSISQMIFMIALMLSMMIGVFISEKRDRNLYSIIRSLSIPIGIYTLIANMKTHPILITGIIAFISVLLTIARIVKKNYKSRKNIKHVTKAAARALLCATCVLAVIVVGISNAFFTKTNSSFKVGEVSESGTIADGGDDYSTVSFLQQFEEKKWAVLSKDDRMQALKELCEYEMNYLGITRDLQISFANLAGRHILGAASPENGIILIDENYLTEGSKVYNARAAMNTIIHEIFHIYEHELMELSEKLNDDEKKLLKFNSVNDYLLESENYISGTLDYSGYYNQLLEKDSRAYAGLRVNENYYIIENLFTNKDLNP